MKLTVKFYSKYIWFKVNAWMDGSIRANERMENCTPKSPMYITKTCLYNFDPLKPRFYIEELEFTGVYIIFITSAET